MKPFEHILILSDLDNTFLGANSRLVNENLEAIERFKALGGKFAFATGRDPFALLDVVPTAPQIANYPCIVTNGAYSYDLAKRLPLDEHPVNRQKLFPIIDRLLQQHPNVSLRFSTAERFLTPKLTEVLRKNLQNFIHADEELSRTREVALRDIPEDTVIYKAVFHGENHHLLALRDDILTYDLSEFSCYFSCEVLFEVLDREGTKGQRVETLKTFDPAITYTYGVGDHENDLQLLQHADCACCPANAIDSVQEAAKVHLCDCDKGAIADLISRIEHAKGGIIL